MVIQDNLNADKQDAFNRLMELGDQARAQGDKARAHRRWRRAALLQPQSEDVWLALYTVLEGEEDRRTCLHNILAINPQNFYAQEELATFHEDTSQARRQLAPLATPAPRALGWVFRGSLFLLELCIVTAFLALALLLLSNI